MDWNNNKTIELNMDRYTVLKHYKAWVSLTVSGPPGSASSEIVFRMEKFSFSPHMGIELENPSCVLHFVNDCFDLKYRHKDGTLYIKNENGLMERIRKEDEVYMTIGYNLVLYNIMVLGCGRKNKKRKELTNGNN